MRLRHVAEINPPTPEFDVLSKDKAVTFLPLEAVWPGSGLDVSETRPKGVVSSGYTRFRDNDVLVPKITPTFEADRSTIARGLCNGIGAGTTELHILRPGPQLEVRYANYLVSSREFLQGGKAAMKGVAGQQRVPDDWLRDFYVPVSDPTRQSAIADFLDAETFRIDSLVVKKQQILELLSQRRMSLSHDLLKGAGITGPRRPSGVSWIGHIPTTWETPAVGHRFDVQLGRMLNQERLQGDYLKPYLRNLNVGWGQMYLDDVAFMDFPPSERSRYRLRAGVLLVCEGGAGVGESAVWNGEIDECYYQKSLHRVRPRGDWPVEWLSEWLRVWKAVGAHEAEGNLATIPHLTAEQFKAHRLPMPDPRMCRKLLRDLYERERRINSIAATVTRQLALITEHRQALITAAVTGQLKVPEVAA